ncbi:hypothetical protein ASPWEDRAFT_531408 [Aspergillus wentii DTO 134E9]|uniref:AA1-like domain-containing protein n=1 Tax=Aspergillus wentii DTO 134E9 TaxID=1073089 RepID=A0A1L9RLM0_ASPWE|nr:uncharacterized protein ASPWEDRAFT_531408 [Aspergillus wentii DTO 134E9]KAI9929706.1 hypothetical protein MW887_001182 [Aspergillus wentii]OJJ35839.1 hypothetical protein ASPWEDRAFT_531408 [Aspergillus wentii DTO 134E9]
MQFTITTVLSLLTASVAASPLQTREANQVTFALSNDQSGAYASVNFHADGTDQYLSSLFAGTSVAADGHVLASSAQLTAFPQTVVCTLKNNGVTIDTLTAQHTYVDLDAYAGSAYPINLDGGVINCWA